MWDLMKDKIFVIGEAFQACALTCQKIWISQRNCAQSKYRTAAGETFREAGYNAFCKTESFNVAYAVTRRWRLNEIHK